MSTYIELCVDLHLEAGMAGNAPSSVIGQVGDNKRVAYWIKRAWQDIQISRNDWLFLRQDFELQLEPNKIEYGKAELIVSNVPNASRFKTFDYLHLTCYQAQSGINSEYEMHYFDYPSFRDYFMRGETISATPNNFSVNDKGNIVLDCYPSQTTIMRGTFYKKPQVLTENLDIPDMPDDYHHLITLTAFIKYGYFESASEVIENARLQERKLGNALINDQTPEIVLGGE